MKKLLFLLSVATAISPGIVNADRVSEAACQRYNNAMDCHYKGGCRWRNGKCVQCGKGEKDDETQYYCPSCEEMFGGPGLDEDWSTFCDETVPVTARPCPVRNGIQTYTLEAGATSADECFVHANQVVLAGRDPAYGKDTVDAGDVAFCANKDANNCKVAPGCTWNTCVIWADYEINKDDWSTFFGMCVASRYEVSCESIKAPHAYYDNGQLVPKDETAFQVCTYNSGCRAVEDGMYIGSGEELPSLCPEDFPYSIPHAATEADCYINYTSDMSGTYDKYIPLDSDAYNVCEHFCNSAGTSTCTLYYDPATKGPTCVKPGGGSGATTCKAGTGVQDGGTECKPCPQNTFNDGMYRECQDCTEFAKQQSGDSAWSKSGWYTESEGANAFTSCRLSCSIYYNDDVSDYGDAAVYIEYDGVGGYELHTDKCQQEACSPGYRRYWDPTFEIWRCEQCNEDTYNPDGTGSSCEPCGTGASSSLDRSTCVCDVGHYNPDPTGNPHNTNCSSCKENHYCPTAGKDPIPCPGGLKTICYPYAGAYTCNSNGTVITGAMSIKACGIVVPAGKYVNCGTETSSGTLQDCPEGYYCPGKDGADKNIVYSVQNATYMDDGTPYVDCSENSRGEYPCNSKNEKGEYTSQAYCPGTGNTEQKFCASGTLPYSTISEGSVLTNKCRGCTWDPDSVGINCDSGQYYCNASQNGAVPAGSYPERQSDGKCALNKCPGFSTSAEGNKSKNGCYIGGGTMKFVDSGGSFSLPQIFYMDIK